LAFPADSQGYLFTPIQNVLLPASRGAGYCPAPLLELKSGAGCPQSLAFQIPGNIKGFLLGSLKAKIQLGPGDAIVFQTLGFLIIVEDLLVGVIKSRLPVCAFSLKEIMISTNI
jgi:hypothetical protein